MFGVLKNFLNSEKAMASGVLVIASSVMVATGQLSPQEWMAYTQNLLGIYVAGKTVQGGVSAIANRKAKDTGEAATAGLAKMETEIAGNDSAADSAIDEKFGEIEPLNVDVDEAPTDPGKKKYAASSEG